MEEMHEKLKGRVRSIVTRSLSIMNNIMGFLAEDSLEGFDSLVDDVYGQKIADLYSAVIESRIKEKERENKKEGDKK